MSVKPDYFWENHHSIEQQPLRDPDYSWDKPQKLDPGYVWDTQHQEQGDPDYRWHEQNFRWTQQAPDTAAPNRVPRARSRLMDETKAQESRDGRFLLFVGSNVNVTIQPDGFFMVPQSLSRSKPPLSLSAEHEQRGRRRNRRRTPRRTKSSDDAPLDANRTSEGRGQPVPYSNQSSEGETCPEPAQFKRSYSGDGLPRRGLIKGLSVTRLLLNASKAEDPAPPVKCSIPRPQLDRMISLRFKATDFVQQRTDAFSDHYSLGHLLGEGAFGSVYEGVCKRTGAIRAIKVIDKTTMSEYDYEGVVNEFTILKELDHPNILKMYEFFEDNRAFCIVTDLARGGELYDELVAQRRFSENDVAALMGRILSCCKYLEEHGVVHRDLNLENILLESSKDFDQVKIIDFGLATKLQKGERLTELTGKAHYVSPEVLHGEYGSKADVWAAGITAHICLVGCAPFDAERDADIYEQILDGTIDFCGVEWQGISDEAKDFVKLLLTHEEGTRPSAKEALEHPFIAKHVQATAVQFKRRSSTEAMSALGKMRKFSAANRLQQVTCSFIASQLLDPEEKEGVDAVFKRMDLDCDGVLSKSEIRSGYREFFDEDLDDFELDGLFHRIDLDGSGSIEYSEFVIATMENSSLFGGNRLRAAFDNFDRHGSGSITADDLRHVLSQIVDKEASIDNVINAVIKQVRGNQITYSDFKALVCQSPTEESVKLALDDLTVSESESDSSIEWDAYV